MNSEPRNEPLAIVGIGCLFPKAAGPGFYWANVKHGVDCIGPVPDTHWNPDDYFDPDPKAPDMTYARRGGFLDVVDFNPLEFGIAPRDIEATDTTQLLGMVAAKQALTDAGVRFADRGQESGVRNRENTNLGSSPTPDSRPPTPGVSRDRVSVILGVTGTLELVIPLGARLGHPKWKRAMKAAGVADEQIEDAAARIAESYVPWQENSFPGLLGNVVAGRIANRLDLGGTNCVVDAACASSLSAVHLAALELQTGRADVVVTGGADTFNDIFMYMCFSKTPALSPTGDAKPFDANGDGTILGEGLGMVVLKRLADAERDGDTVYAVIKGIGSSSDGKGNAIYAPSAAGQKKCLLNAYTAAGVTPDTIELVEAHGTGTKVGDTTEITALTEVYTSDFRLMIEDLRLKNEAKPAEHNLKSEISNLKSGPWCAIGSVKSQIGHTKAAAGAASLIKAALALYNKVLPPTAKVTQPVEPLRAADTPFYVNTRMRPWLPRAGHPRRAALSAFGFGGSNFHAVLEEHRPEKRDPDWDGAVEIVALSAGTPQQLIGEVERLLKTTNLDWPSFARAAAASRAAFNPAAACRLAFAAHRDTTDVAKLLAGAKARLAAEPTAASWHTPDGVHYGTGPAGQLAVLFPGQGSQAVGMLRDLACLFPELLDTLAAANAATEGETPDGRRLSDRIYPPTTFDSERLAADDRELRDTRNAQPSIGAVSFGAWRVLADRFGLKADAFAGHSYGELVALAAARRLNPDDLFALSRLRGELMAQQRPGDPGTMLAVLAPLPDIERVLKAEKLDLVIANQNAPKQAVLSGATAEIERAEKTFASAGVKTARLPVAAAFHSPLVADAARPFRTAIDSIPLYSPGSAPVYANTTAAPYPADERPAKDLLANQLAKPVRFADQVRAMAAAGVRTFVEVGPGAVLTRLVEAVFADNSQMKPDAFAVDASGGKRPGVLDFGSALARLAAAGHPVTLIAWEAGSRCRPTEPTGKAGLTIPLTGANYVSPRQPRPARPASVNGRHQPGSQKSIVVSAPASPETRLPTVKVPPMPETPADPNALANALAMTQQSLAALQRMQEQTAQLHRQFLESQEAAQRTLQALVDQQQSLLLSGLGAGVELAPPRVAATQEPVRVAAKPDPQPTAVPVVPVSVPKPVPDPPQVAAKPEPRVDVSSVLLAVVSEKTGYPAESLDLGLSLDADLGVDSIKRVEILAALQERLPAAPVVKPEHLGTLHTLRDVADFLAGPAAPPAAADPDEDLAQTMPLTPGQLLELGQLVPGAAATTDVSSVLLAVVSEKTGYPAESLDLGLSLDADLGVDSIKRVEILAALQERLPAAPVVKPEHLGTLHTLRDVADFLAGKTGPKPVELPPSGPATTKVPIVATVTQPADATTQPAGELTPPDTEHLSNIRPPQAAEAAPGSQRVPATPPRPTGESSRPGLSGLGSDRVDRSILQVVDLDPGSPRSLVPLPAGAEIWIVGDADPLTEAVTDRLAQAGYGARVMAWSGPGTNRPGGPLGGLVLLAPAEAGTGSGLARRACEWLQQVGPKLRQTGRLSAAVFAAVARLDGAFGLNDLSPDADPTGGGLAGVVKTARHEWPELTCKVIDLHPDFPDTAAAAAAVVEEVLTAGPVEVGITPTHRCTVELARTVRRASSQTINLGPRDVVLVTGGARGVTAEAAVALAEAYRPVLVLTGRTPAPGPEPDWLAGLTTETEIKKALAARLGADAGPKQIGEQYQKIATQREVRRTLARIEQAGAKVAYFPVNITDPKAVAGLLQQVRVKYGPVAAVVHGAGVLADRRIEDLTAEQFDHVYATKVDGLRNLLDLLTHEDLKALVLFSSTTARFGRTGQMAYAAANEVLNKTAQVEARRRPGCRVVSINWGPWEGGMVTPGLRKMFEAEGVGLIPLADGAAFLVQELNAAGKAVEVIALGKPRIGSGMFPASATTRPVHHQTPAPSAGLAVGTAPGPQVSPPNPAPAADLTPAFERTVEIDAYPVLRSHVLDGRAVLPASLHLEWLAHAALHNHPGLVFHGFNDLRITEGVKLDPGGAVSLRAHAGKAVKQDRLFLVPVELRGKRKDGREVLKSRAEIVLATTLPKPPPADRPPAVDPFPFTVDEAYRDLLFHGPDLHGIDHVAGVAETAFIGTARPAPPPTAWFRQPLRSGWVANPLVLDCAFQMMILWTQHRHQLGSLPNFAGRYRQFRRGFPDAPTTVVIRVTRDNGTFVRADIDFLDPDGQVIAQMQDYECMMEKSLAQAFRRNQLGLVRQ